MKSKILTLIALLCFYHGFAHSIPNEDQWSSDELSKANTVSNVDFLSTKEKEVIILINLGRLYPKKFADVYVSKLEGDACENCCVDLKKSTEKNHLEYQKNVTEQFYQRVPTSAFTKFHEKAEYGGDPFTSNLSSTKGGSIGGSEAIYAAIDFLYEDDGIGSDFDSGWNSSFESFSLSLGDRYSGEYQYANFR